MKVSQEHSSFRHGQAMVKATACLLMLSAGSVITPVQAAQESIGNAAATATQQAGTVKKGVVRDVNGEPIIGASVVEKGNTSNGTVTDLNGNYTLKLKNPKAKLVVSYIGFVTQETTGGTITLQEDLKGLTAGSKLADGDAGEQVNGDDQVVGTTTIYNNVARGKEGWTYGFVALKSDGTRVYGDIKLLAQAFVMDASKLSSYTIKPVLVYTKGGKQYKATITLNMKY